MSIFIPVTGCGLARTTGAFLNPAGSYSFMFWVENAAKVVDIITAEPRYQVYSVLGDFTYTNAYVATFSNHQAASPFDETDFELDTWTGALEATTTGVFYETPTIWTHCAVTYNGGTHVFKYYINGWLSDTVTLDMSANTFTAERLGLDSAGIHGGFSIGYYRSWAAELTNAEIRLEMASTSAVKATPFCDTPLTNTSTLNDVSGNARNWTAVGAITNGTGPTLRGATNTNTNATDAYELATLPVTNCQQCGDLATTLDVWYKLTWSDPDAYIAVFGQGSNSGYTPSVKVYDGLTAALALGPIYRGFNALSNRPLTIPMYQGHVYYFFVDTNAALTPVLVMSALETPDGTVPTGSIAVNDDTDGFPLALMSSTTGEPIDYVLDFPAGENAHILDDGTLLVNGIGAIGGEGIFSLDENLTLLAGPISTGITFLDPDQACLSSDRDATFYVCGTNSGATSFIGTTIPVSTWTASATLYHPAFKTAFPGLLAIAPSLDGTILYYSTTDEYIQRWDLVNDTALSDLASPVTNYTLAGIGASGTADILVMPDGSIVVAYQRLSTVATKLIIYEANGSIRATYDYASILFNHIAHDGASSTTIWGWFYLGNPAALNGRFSVFKKIDVTDGSIVQETETVPQYQVGGYLAKPTIAQVTNGARPDPVLRYGHSNSCAFWITRASITPPVPPLFTVEERPIRRLRRAPHLSNEHKRLFYPGFELEVQRGVGILADPGRQPQIMLRVSRDGGQTWGSYMNMSAGALGEYKARPRVQRLGTSRDMVFEITTSDPNDFEIINAWLTPDPIAGDS